MYILHGGLGRWPAALKISGGKSGAVLIAGCGPQALLCRQQQAIQWGNLAQMCQPVRTLANIWKCFIASGSCGRFKPASELALESSPFDIFVMNDIRTSLQVACFYELGSTADLQQDVGKTWRDSYGVGLRMITASGVVFRADIANGQDGVATEIFIGYPWEIF
jgi:hypothetical protein